MPSVLEDPHTPHPPPPNPAPPTLDPRQITLKDSTPATLHAFTTPSQLPPALLAHTNAMLNAEIEAGDTYPMTSPMPPSTFSTYWFGSLGAILLAGDLATTQHLLATDAADIPGGWETKCLGTFYTKPNYPGRSSHISNAGFLTASSARNKGVGRAMGEAYLVWAPLLGYTYSVFNLVYETNVHSMRIWEGLGFERIGRVRGCGRLRSWPGRGVDALQYGRVLGDGDGGG